MYKQCCQYSGLYHHTVSIHDHIFKQIGRVCECKIMCVIRQNFIHEFLDREQYEGIFSKEFGGRENGRLFVC